MAVLVRIDTDLKRKRSLSRAISQPRSLWSRPPGVRLSKRPMTCLPEQEHEHFQLRRLTTSFGALIDFSLTFSPSFSCGFRAMGQMPSKPVMGHIRPSTRAAGGLISGRLKAT